MSDIAYTIAPFKFTGGSTQFFNFTVRNEKNELIDVSNCISAEWKIRPYGEIYTPSLISKSLTNGITIIDTNKIQVRLNPIDTIDLDGKFTYEVSMTDGAGIELKSLHGTIQVNLPILS